MRRTQVDKFASATCRLQIPNPQAEKLLLATDVDGILDGNRAPISRLPPAQAKQLIDKNVITGGMIPKVESAIRALNRSVRSVHVINGTKSGSPLVFTEQGAGTMIYDDVPPRM